MPVLLKNHNPDLQLEPGTTKSDIVALLYSHPELGYKPKEVHEELEIPHSTAKVTLKRLYDSEDIGKTADGHYHALDSREDLRRYTASLDQLNRIFDTTYDLDEMDGEYTPAMTEEEAETELEELEAELGEQ